MISLIAALETCEYELFCITLHKLEKSTDTIERLKASSVEKFTLGGSKFQTLSVKVGYEFL